MVIGVSRLELLLPECGSLKEKRRVVKSILDRVKNKFGVSAAEIDHHDLRQRASLGIACIVQTNYQAKKLLSKVERFVEQLNKANILNNHVTTLVLEE